MNNCGLLKEEIYKENQWGEDYVVKMLDKKQELICNEEVHAFFQPMNPALQNFSLRVKIRRDLRYSQCIRFPSRKNGAMVNEVWQVEKS